MRPKSSAVRVRGDPDEKICGAGATGGLVGPDLNLSPVVRLMGTGSGDPGPPTPGVGAFAWCEGGGMCAWLWGGLLAGGSNLLMRSSIMPFRESSTSFVSSDTSPNNLVLSRVSPLFSAACSSKYTLPYCSWACHTGHSVSDPFCC